MRPQLLVLVVVGALTSGCSSPAGGDPMIEIPWPAAGASAKYDGPPTLTVSIGGPMIVRNAAGAPVESLQVFIDLLQPDAQARSYFSQFIDREGRRVLVAAACPKDGVWLTRSGDNCADRALGSANYLDAGLPGALGASALWGRSLPRSGPFVVESSLLGVAHRAVYDVSPAPDVGESCVTLDAGSTAPAAWGGYFTFVASVPQRMLACSGEPFPRSIEFAHEGRYQLRDSATPRGPGAAPAGFGIDPTAAPDAPAARRVAGALPLRPGEDPHPFSLNEAFTKWRIEDPTVDAFLDAHPNARLASTHTPSVGFGAGPQGLLAEHRISREIVLVTSDGRALSGSLEEHCLESTCRITFLGSQESAEFEPRAEITIGSYAALYRDATRSDRSPPWVQLTLYLPNPGNTTASGPGDRYFAIFGASRAAADGTVPTRIYDTRSELLLRADAPHAEIEAWTGVPKARLLPPS